MGSKRYYTPQGQRRAAAGYPPAGYSAYYGPANYRIDGHAPTVVPDLALSAAHDWDGFEKNFPQMADGSARPKAFVPAPAPDASAPPDAPDAPPPGARDLAMTAPHDWSGFTKEFPRKSQGQAKSQTPPAKAPTPSTPSTAPASSAPADAGMLPSLFRVGSIKSGSNVERLLDRAAGAQPPASRTSAPANSSAPAPSFNGTVRNAPADVNGSLVQGLLDKASGVQPTSPTNTATDYGKGGVRFDPSARAENQKQAAYDRATSGEYGPIMVSKYAPTGTLLRDANGNAYGVQGDALAARQNLFASHPEVFQKGTPENAAIVNYAKSTNPLTGQPYGEEAAIANAGNLMKSIAKGSATPTPAQTAASQAAQQTAAQAQADAGPFNVGTVGGDAMTGLKHLDLRSGDAAERTLRSIGITDQNAKDVGDYLRYGNNESDVAQNERNTTTDPGVISAQARAQSLAREGGTSTGDVGAQERTASVKPGAISNKARALSAARERGTPASAVANNVNAAPKPASPATPASAQPAMFAPTATTPNSAPTSPGSLTGSSPTPGLDNYHQMQDNKVSGAPLATASNAPDLDAKAANQHMPSTSTLEGPPAPTSPSEVIQQKVNSLNNDDALQGLNAGNEASNETPEDDSAPASDMAAADVPNDARGGFIPNYAFGYATEGGGDQIDLADNMRRANSMPNVFHPPHDPSSDAGNPPAEASAFTPQARSQPTAADRAEAATWKGDMQSAQNVLNSYDKQYDPSAGTTTQQLAGPNGPMATVEGTPPPKNFARGRVPGYAAGRRLFAPAIKRERRAIAAGVGGAPRTAKAQPVVLAGRPAVINSSEKVLPTPAGVAVLNRDMQRRLGGGGRGKLRVES
ncbi:hypothetical protein CfE428DRAFT_4206 [Chthoniobacter flavus Ellin428]|uniref:Uncharacterized protein n=1 Tax=Chthoniobacter flavus Ellin428 TaxID=497964 RepID=B4D5L7_9BACT|nr:hypothetical protein [Chthoniobacter flavus]EDY18422.1 hypothetical protein CfE428DRAFT_4206 [Chthoniobacter flavus Ellin428]TCO90869.1 hypothetical protein EV701_10918 [Chthoniobacter flavus]